MRAQLFEKTLNDIVKIIDEHLGDGLQVGATDRKQHSDDRTVLAKIRRLAAKATDRAGD
jgi:hypothetical protein